MYDRIARAKGTGIAEVLMQKCMACQMMQRPQRWNDLRDRDNRDLMTCESCGRLLWYNAETDSPGRKPVERGEHCGTDCEGTLKRICVDMDEVMADAERSRTPLAV